MVKNKQKQVGRLHAVENKKKVQDALHDTDATDNKVDYPDLIDKKPDP
jgi:hypothetical protein